MSLQYLDKRSRFNGVQPSEVPAANPRFDNPVKAGIAQCLPARREATAPRDKFRVKTDPALNMPVIEPKPPKVQWDDVPKPELWEL